MIITDKTSRIHVTVLDVEPAVRVEEQGDLQVFMSWWKAWAKERGVPPRIDGADWRLARLMLQEEGLDLLKRYGVIFWSQHSDPLVTGEYQRHMILFRAKMTEVKKDLANLGTH